MPNLIIRDFTLARDHIAERIISNWVPACSGQPGSLAGRICTSAGWQRNMLRQRLRFQPYGRRRRLLGVRLLGAAGPGCSTELRCITGLIPAYLQPKPQADETHTTTTECRPVRLRSPHPFVNWDALEHARPQTAAVRDKRRIDPGTPLLGLQLGWAAWRSLVAPGLGTFWPLLLRHWHTTQLSTRNGPPPAMAARIVLAGPTSRYTPGGRPAARRP